MGRGGGEGRWETVVGAESRRTDAGGAPRLVEVPGDHEGPGRPGAARDQKPSMTDTMILSGELFPEPSDSAPTDSAPTEPAMSGSAPPDSASSDPAPAWSVLRARR